MKKIVGDLVGAAQHTNEDIELSGITLGPGEMHNRILRNQEIILQALAEIIVEQNRG